MSEASTVDEYIADFPDAVQQVLQHVRETIRAALPDCTETISYQIPTMQVGSQAVMYFAGWKKHVSMYPVPEGDTAYARAIAPYQSGRGTLKFALDKPIPYDLIGRTATLLAERSARH
ncbi:MAG: hypothetical protein JWN03_4152 [Nocardia sp.]|uniref:iron chaperone n=1 Tax=Nocardia sp. TaxID=1821 RepID=UPI00261F89A3|nr:DUF1801 domain-containing protein [Nocardia sp.]MCU1643877.1 hypothetical protein [Nocardia sp.]